jgi:Holliday junction resolvasome RuvABC endonuclease subunit
LLSLDVSSTACGWAVGRIESDASPTILDFGVIKPTASWDSTRRTDWMSMKIASLVQKHDVAAVVMEFQSHCHTGKRVQGLAVLGQAQGAVRAYLAMTHKVETVTEREWTRRNGKNQKKEARAEYVKQVVPDYAARAAEDPRFDPGLDASDAIGLILWRAGQ